MGMDLRHTSVRRIDLTYVVDSYEMMPNVPQDHPIFRCYDTCTTHPLKVLQTKASPSPYVLQAALGISIQHICLYKLLDIRIRLVRCCADIRVGVRGLGSGECPNVLE